MDGIAKSPSAATATTVTVTTSTCENLQVLTPEAITEAVAFGMSVREETVDESASVRKRSAEVLTDHHYNTPQTQTETDNPAPKRKKPQVYVLIPVSFVSEPTQSWSESESEQEQEPFTRPSGIVRDEPLSSSLDSFPELDTNPFDTAFKEAQSAEALILENHNSVDGGRLEEQYGPFRKSPDLQKREQALFDSTTRM